MSEETVLVYVTAPSHEEALRLAHLAVGERLAACANVLGPITSVYWWDGKVNQEPEVAMVLKTRAGQAEALVARLKAAHPYDCPCVVVLPIAAGNPDFLGWIRTETGG
ncbi:MAG TPA: divalent-cation tolerance protein CutA [Magnetospirillum sp.]|nr:divalent-cation tolerance protein CutA [Magnetospirillum sp.]